MTAEQIEELRTLTEEASSADTFLTALPEDMAETDLQWLEAARNMLPRLLNERDRLLAAAKRCVLPANQTQMADAIMYAEEDVS